MSLMNSLSGPTRLICSLISSDVRAMRAEMEQAAAGGAEIVECRLDYLDKTPDAADLEMLLKNPPVDLIVTCRPARQGGSFNGREAKRLKVLRQAAQFSPAFIDVEDDVPKEKWPAGNIILSHHDFAGIPRDLDRIVSMLNASTSAVSKVAFAAEAAEDAFRAFDVLRQGEKPMIVLAMGEAAVCSRILSRKFGAFGMFASLHSGAESAPGQPTIEELKNLYRWNSITPSTAVYGVIGCPVSHSMSPAIHNAAFAAADMNAVYVPVLIEPGQDNFNRFMDELLERPWLDWRGMSVTIPHKENALAFVGASRCDELSRKIGAVNTLTISPAGQVRGDNTDYSAALDALCRSAGMRREELSGKAVAMLGAGGAARAIVAALRHYRADVVIYNRSVSRAKALAEEFLYRGESIDAAGSSEAEILINCTPLGMSPDVEDCPVAEIPPSVRIVFDTIYNPVQTRLLKLAGEKGCATVSGFDMFVNQAVTQFELWTGRPAPLDVMRSVVLQKLGQGS